MSSSKLAETKTCSYHMWGRIGNRSLEQTEIEERSWQLWNSDGLSGEGLSASVWRTTAIWNKLK